MGFLGNLCRRRGCLQRPDERLLVVERVCFLPMSVRFRSHLQAKTRPQPGTTAGECLAEPKEGAFPIWDDNGGCAGICLCTMGSGCYQLAREPAETQHTCDCSPEICAGGEDACSAKGVGNLWSEECTSCQRPLLPTIPTECKARSTIF